MREDPEYRHLAKRYLNRPKGDEGGAESHIGNVRTDEQHQRTQTTKQHADDKQLTKGDITTEDHARTQENLTSHNKNPKQHPEAEEHFGESKEEQFGITDQC